MSDRELLEMAAKAAGYRVIGWINDRFIVCNIAPSDENYDPFHWEPLTDDGDALRLAVKLRLCVDNCVGEYNDRDYVTVGGEDGDTPFVDQDYGSDPYAATRRAIVRAAAEIGRAMG